MAGEVVTLSSEAPLLRDDYDDGRRPRKGKKSGHKARKLGRRKKPEKKRNPRKAVNKRSAIYDAMMGSR